MSPCFRASSSTSSQSSVRRGLAEDGTRFQIPFQAAKKFGRFHADAEFGPLASTVGRSEWLYGIVGGVEVAKTTMLMAELHGTSRTNFTRDVLTVNVGLASRVHRDAHPDRVTRSRDPRSGSVARLHRLFRRAVALLNGVFFGFLQCAFEAGFCGKIRINATIITRSANEAV